MKHDEIMMKSYEIMCASAVAAALAMSVAMSHDLRHSNALSALRSWEAKLHFAPFLGALGLVLLSGSIAWALLRFILVNRFILVLLAGLLCLLLSVASDPRGLLRHLPAETQDFLFNKRVFDLLHDASRQRSRDLRLRRHLNRMRSHVSIV